MRYFFVLAILVPGAFSQSPGNAALSGRYAARHVFFTSPAARSVTDARSLTATFTFDGNGNYTFTGEVLDRDAPPSPLSGSGTYSLDSSGFAVLSHPLRANLSMTARFANGLLAASSVESPGVFDLMVAAALPPGSVPSANGIWWFAGVAFPNANPNQARAVFFRASANAGAFAPITVQGQAANLGNRSLSETITGATYTINPDGSGTANFPLPPGTTALDRLLSGSKRLNLSPDGNFLTMSSTAAGAHELFLGVRAAATAFDGLFWTAGLRQNAGRFNAHIGSATATASSVAFLSRRVRELEGSTDFSGINRFTLDPNGSGRLELGSLAVGAGGAIALGSSASLVDVDDYELLLAFRAPTQTPTPGVFLHPFGVANAASFAPPGNPIAPGMFLTLFGNGLAPRVETAPAAPFPTTLAGVQVLVNGVAAPVYTVSPTQVSAIVPAATTPGNAQVTVLNGATRSNTVTVRVAPTAPGVFAVPPRGFGPGAILKADFSLVTPRNPARRGETVLIFLTGLGAVSPSVADGTPAPANPLSRVTAPVNVYIGRRRANVTFQGLSPNLVALYQLNVEIPANAPGGPAVPLAIETADAFHDQVDIAIAP